MFLPLSSCCLEGSILKGDPAGVMEPATGGRRIARYHAKPQNGQTVNPKAAIVLFYDAFGFTIVRLRNLHLLRLTTC